MPAVGDFFRNAAPSGFVSVWDPWLQKAMLAGQEVLGDTWDRVYMSAPIWRFTLSPGLAGASKVMGVLMPSVDRVGRRFPLTVMGQISTSGPAARDHFHNAHLFTQLEDVALSALDDDATREAFDTALGALPAPATPPPILVRREGGSIAATQEGSDTILAELAAASVPGPRATASLWSCEVEGVSRLLVDDGLPDGLEMLALFNLGSEFWKEGRNA